MCVWVCLEATWKTYGRWFGSKWLFQRLLCFSFFSLLFFFSSSIFSVCGAVYVMTLDYLFWWKITATSSLRTFCWVVFFRSRNVTFERLVISLRTILMDMMCVWAFNTCIFDLFCAVLHEMAQGNDNKITWCSAAYLIRLGHPRDNTFTVLENWQMKWNDH